ncbi:MAG TPA: hypothetical protein VN451_08525 [Chitinophagaceae bacterium]|nr:hypothetical protein [Chitinophagaceae bacterium]
MKLITFLTLFLVNTSIYTLQFQDTDGNTIPMSNYQNKKILLVNIATNGTRVSQLAGLQQLHQTYGDSVAIIAFPSNSFGHEPRTNAEIKQFCQNNYGVTFKIAAKNSVAGTGIQSIYNWLAHASENGVMDGIVGGDFQKFLIDKTGSLIGVFAPSVAPMDSLVVNALTGN